VESRALFISKEAIWLEIALVKNVQIEMIYLTHLNGFFLKQFPSL